VSGRPSPGAGGAGVDLDDDGWHGWSLPVDLRLGGCSAGAAVVTDKTGTGRSGWEGKLLVGQCDTRSHVVSGYADWRTS
jgi:hypothetical protein